MKLTASQILKKQYKGNKNFMTPNKLKVGKLNSNMAFELSSGRFGSNMMYGVTIVSVNKSGRTTPQYNLSKSFGTKNEAEAYINKLKNRFQNKK